MLHGGTAARSAGWRRPRIASREPARCWLQMGFFLSALEVDVELEEDIVEDTKCILETLEELDNKLPRFSSPEVRRVIDHNETFARFSFILETGGQYCE